MSERGTYEQIKNGLGYLKLARSGELFATLVEQAKTEGWDRPGG